MCDTCGKHRQDTGHTRVRKPPLHCIAAGTEAQR